jgi:alkaline phosphatase D
MRGSVEKPGRTVGVAALYDAKGKYVYKSVRFVQLHRQYDRTGVVEFASLTPDTAYQVRVGSLTLAKTYTMISDDDIDVFSKLPAPEDFLNQLESLPAEASLASFTTYPEKASNGLAFIFGSCRYPGLLWPANKADQIFAAIRDQLTQPDPPRFVLMNGDQIYADKLGRHIPLLRANTPAEFQERYKTAFTSKNMRELLRSVPTYMILDDHDIEDDWTATRMDGNEKEYVLYQNAIAAYKNYQWIQSPRNHCPSSKVTDIVGDRFCYSFDCGGFPFFVIDSRTHRIKNEEPCNLEENHMLGYPSESSVLDSRVQINVLYNWLLSQHSQFGNQPKFIVSPSMFAPNKLLTAGSDEHAMRNKARDDSWAAFPNTRRKILDTIVQHNIQNVVFLCGDAHCSCIAELSFTHKTGGKLPLRALSITSSAFYWPWPFADGKPDSFVHDSKVQNDQFEVNADVVMNYKAYAFEQADNFTRIDASSGFIEVQNYDREGVALGNKTTLKLFSA